MALVTVLKSSFFAKDEAIPVIEELKTLNKQAPVAEIETKKVAIQQKDKTKVIQETMPKVFTILTEVGQGSGFLYEQGGYIVTNAHVVAGYTDVIVRNSAGKTRVQKLLEYQMNRMLHYLFLLNTQKSIR